MLSNQILTQIITCLQIKEEEKILLIGDATTRFLIDGLRDVLTSAHVIYLDESKRPYKMVPDHIKSNILSSDLTFFAVDKVANETVDERTFRDEMCALAELQGRVGNMMSVTLDILESGFGKDTQKIKEFTQRIFSIVKPIQKMHVTTAKGSDFIVEFSDQYKWLESTGFIERKIARNVMPAEVYTHPHRINGTIVIDGTYGYLTSLEEYKNDLKHLIELLDKSPLIWTVKDSRIINVTCADKKMETLVRNLIATNENADRIGEFGLGTNLNINKLKGVVFHDEKYPGVHIANGHGYGTRTGCTYTSPVHSDGILKKVTVKLLDTNTYLIKDGKYVI